MRVLDRFNLDGRVAVIPGGSGAIGSSLAIGLAAAGAKVSVVGRNPDRVEQVVKTLTDQGSVGFGVTADVTAESDAQRAVDETVAEFGRVDIIVNAVGGGAGEVLHDAEAYPQNDWDWIFDLNVRSTVLPTQAAVRAMIDAGNGGRVLNVSSVRGQLGINAGYSAYVAAKGAVDSLTRQWATEWAKHSITVNAISPTFVDTPQVAMLLDDPDFKAGIINRVPLRRIGETDDLLGASLLFCSDASAFITGQILTIDGGLTATQ